MLKRPQTEASPAPSEAAFPELARLLERPLHHVRWGLGRITRILNELGDPHRSYATVHIAGTNGKGSTAALVAAALDHAGPTGLYTSPHLTRFSERVRIGGLEAPLDLLDRCAARVRPLADREGATYFEATTALGFLAFAEAGVDTAVVEVGLGGRLDATNVLNPDACVITNIAREHTDMLGDSLEEIATEKAGILREGVPAVLGLLETEPAAAVRERATLLRAPLIELGRDATVESVHCDATGTRFVYRSAAASAGLDVSIPLIGAHQASNAALALLTLEQLDAPVAAPGVLDALRRVRWPGRFEVLPRSDGTYVLDTAHNPAGATSLARTIRDIELARPIVLVLGVLLRKPLQEIVGRLQSAVDRCVFTRARTVAADESWDPEDAALRHPGALAAPTVPAALRIGRELAGRGTVVVAGSCYTVGEAREYLVEDHEQEPCDAIRSPVGAADAGGADAVGRAGAADRRGGR